MNRQAAVAEFTRADKLEDESIGHSEALWSKVNGLLKMPATPTTLKYTADEFAAHPKES